MCIYKMYNIENLDNYQQETSEGLCAGFVQAP